MYEEISQKIKRIRNSTNLSLDRFGKKIGVSGKTISAYENGKITPSPRVLDKIAKTYDVSVVTLSKSKQEILTKRINELEKALSDIKNLVT